MKQCLLLSLIAMISCADVSSPEIAVESAWVRPNVPPVKNAAGYMILRNPASVSRALIGAATDVCDVTELHVMEHDGQVMRMRKVERIPIPARGTTQLQPGGNHLMLIGLNRDLAPGDTIAITLTFDSGKHTLRAPVIRPQDRPGQQP